MKTKNNSRTNKKRKYLIPSLKPSLYKAWNYIRESKNYIYSSIILFCVFVIFGFVFHSNLEFITAYLQKIISLTQNLKGIDLIAFIFKNNLQSSFFSLFLGVFLGLFTLINIIFNGVVIGFVMEKVSSNLGILDLWKLLPHGIFELPAIFISMGLGLKLGASLFSKKGIQNLRKNLYRSLLTFVLIVVPLLTIAAIIEGLLITFIK